MGTLHYIAAQYAAEIEDRTLAHLQIVICNKLRRNERFTLTLSPADGFSGSETVLWFASSLPVRFSYASAAHLDINTAWLYQLADAACSRTGLRIVPEPKQEPAAAPVAQPARRENVPA